VLVNISKTQDDEVGDGTTSVCVLAAELLREAEKLINAKIHPQTIIAGNVNVLPASRIDRYNARLESCFGGGARELTCVSSRQQSRQRCASVQLQRAAHMPAEKLRLDMLNIARTTLSSKIVHQDKEHFAQLCVDAVIRLNGSTDLQAVHIIKKVGGSLRDSALSEGFVLEKRIGVGQPKLLLNPKILIANTAMDADRNKIFGVRVRTESTAAVAAIEEAERKRMLDKCEKIVAHGVQCTCCACARVASLRVLRCRARAHTAGFVNRQLIYNRE
jgi:T-complex protein 1 subunit beta